MPIEVELDIPLATMIDEDDALPAQVTFGGARHVWCRGCRWIGTAAELVPEHWNGDDDHGLCPRCLGRAGLRPIHAGAAVIWSDLEAAGAGVEP